jgi:nucleoside-diphosphate-sugar epimerase
MRKVLITGINGFLGSEIAKKLVAEGTSVIGLKRPKSDIWRCTEFADQIDWVDIVPGYGELLIQKKPSIMIHCAWIGVEAKYRDDWAEQIKNILFLSELLFIAKKVDLEKIVVLGSQAEYGILNNVVTEDFMAVATNAYAGIKLAILEIVKVFSETNNINWVWLRIFSVLGETESEDWLIPATIKKMKHSSEMDLTFGEQKYAYLYIRDFAEILYRIVNYNIKSGIYNVSASKAQSLRSIIEGIRSIVNPSFKLNFGALEYRHKQSMHIQGDMSKLTNEIGEVPLTDFNVALKSVINYNK